MRRRREALLSLLGAVVVVGGSVFGAVKLLEHASNRAVEQRPAATFSVPASVAAPPPRGAAPQQSVPFATAPNQQQSAPAYTQPSQGSGQTAVYRCKQAGRTVYSDVPCDGARSQVVEVRPSSGFQPPARSYQSSAPRPVQQPDLTPPQNPPDANAAPARAMQCTLIDQQIAAIDAEARQPLSIPRQDQLRKQRAALVDQRYALNCHLARQ
jgi:hypothetical protein